MPRASSSREAGESHGGLGGVLLIVIAVLCFSGMDGSAKWVSRRVNPTEVVALRYVISFLLSLVFFNPWTRPGLMRTKRPGLQVVRALCVLASTAAGWTAMRHLPLTQVTAIVFSAPLLVALLAGPLLGERIGPRRLVAVGVGFAGVLVVTRPFAGAWNVMTLFALTAALANAMFSLLARKLAAHDKPETTLFYTGLIGSAVMLPVLPFTWQTPAGVGPWAVLLLLGALGVLAHWMVIAAHRIAPASMLAPYTYTQLVGSVTIGFLIFGEVPDRWTLVGSVVVVGSGLYLAYRERVRQKPVPSADVPA